MEMMLAPELTICGIEELPAQSSRQVTHVLSIIDPDRAELTAFSTYGDHVRTTLRFHDIISPVPGQIMPTPEHVEEILNFGQSFHDRKDLGVPSHILVHCHMGVSRSTAAMMTLMAQANPNASAETLFERLAIIRPQAWPNSQMIAFADEQLGRKGDLSRELARHYGRQLKSKPEYGDWMTSLGRKAEVDMAIL